MNTLRNSVQLIGHLGKTPELITLEKGRLVVKATLATHETYTSNNGEHITNTHWHNLVAWGRLAENMSRILEKGTAVLIKGKLVTRSYEDKSGIPKACYRNHCFRFLQMQKNQVA
ncbi:MAG: single-stranded DNA-binding protein [Saprospiraceae bacterium]|nr:single-stranded DNA-binding protein [Candidatus Vicinibacter affinis]